MNYKIIFASLALAHFLKGLAYTVNLFFDPIHDRPGWVNRPDPLHFIFSVIFWFFSENIVIFYTKKPLLKKAFYLSVSYIKGIFILFAIIYLSATKSFI